MCAVANSGRRTARNTAFTLKERKTKLATRTPHHTQDAPAVITMQPQQESTKFAIRGKYTSQKISVFTLTIMTSNKCTSICLLYIQYTICVCVCFCNTFTVFCLCTYLYCSVVILLFYVFLFLSVLV